MVFRTDSLRFFFDKCWEVSQFEGYSQQIRFPVLYCLCWEVSQFEGYSQRSATTDSM